MQTPKNITVIPATINPVTRLPKESKQLRRVAAYARVSTDSEEQLTSYEAQVDYYRLRFPAPTERTAADPGRGHRQLPGGIGRIGSAGHHLHGCPMEYCG